MGNLTGSLEVDLHYQSEERRLDPDALVLYLLMDLVVERFVRALGRVEEVEGVLDQVRVVSLALQRELLELEST